MKQRMLQGTLSAFVTFAALLTADQARAQSTCGAPGTPNNGSCYQGYTNGTTGGHPNITAYFEADNAASALDAVNSNEGNGTITATNNATGTATTPEYGAAIYGTTTVSGGNAIFGYSSGNATGVEGQSSSGYGVDGVSSSGDGVFATSSSGYGLYAITTSGSAAVYATTGGGNYAVQAVTTATNGIAVNASANVSGGIGVDANGVVNGVYATSSSGHAVEGASTSGTGVYASSSSGNGVYGTSGSSSLSGVYAVTTGNGRALHAVVSPAGTGTAVWGENNYSTGWAGYFTGNVNVTGTLTCGSGCSSDRRLKQNIEPLTGAIDKLLQLKGVTFEWKNPEEHQNHTGTQVGVIAQEVEKVFPQWVRVNESGFKNVDPDARTVLGLTVEGFRELKMENNELRDRVKSLEAGRRPLVSGMGEGGLGLGLCAIAGAMIVTRRKRSEERA
jgi:hypothetical protein